MTDKGKFASNRRQRRVKLLIRRLLASKFDYFLSLFDSTGHIQTLSQNEGKNRVKRKGQERMLGPAKGAVCVYCISLSIRLIHLPSRKEVESREVQKFPRSLISAIEWQEGRETVEQLVVTKGGIVEVQSSTWVLEACLPPSHLWSPVDPPPTPSALRISFSAASVAVVVAPSLPVFVIVEIEVEDEPDAVIALEVVGLYGRGSDWDWLRVWGTSQVRDTEGEDAFDVEEDEEDLRDPSFNLFQYPFSRTLEFCSICCFSFSTWSTSSSFKSWHS